MSEPTKIINFMALRRPAAIVSVVLILLSLLSLGTRGLNLGLDFSGGTLVELEFHSAPDIDDVRTELVNLGVADAIVVFFGSQTDVLLRTREQMVPDCETDASIAASAAAEGRLCVDSVVGDLNAALANQSDVIRIEAVGPQVGEELREDGGLGLLAALLVVMLYVSVRFQYKFSIGAVLALFHDVIIVLGLFSLFQWNFDLSVLAAMLAVIGYSLNDTIVVFDRIRENFRTLRRTETLDAINITLTQVLDRTLVTSLTTLLVLVVLFLLGGEMIRYFSLALILGIVVGTYSSIYIATNALLLLKVQVQDLVPQEPEKDVEVAAEIPYGDR